MSEPVYDDTELLLIGTDGDQEYEYLANGRIPPPPPPSPTDTGEQDDDEQETDKENRDPNRGEFYRQPTLQVRNTRTDTMDMYY